MHRFDAEAGAHPIKKKNPISCSSVLVGFIYSLLYTKWNIVHNDLCYFGPSDA
jgi:hypothetical protein